MILSDIARIKVGESVCTHRAVKVSVPTACPSETAGTLRWMWMVSGESVCPLRVLSMGMEMFCVMRVSVGLIRTHIWWEPPPLIF